MLENPDVLGRMVAESGAHGTDLVEPETPEELREKTVAVAEEWKPVAERLWRNEDDEMFEKRHDPYQGMDSVEEHKFERLGRDVEAERAAAFSE